MKVERRWTCSCGAKGRWFSKSEWYLESLWKEHRVLRHPRSRRVTCKVESRERLPPTWRGGLLHGTTTPPKPSSTGNPKSVEVSVESGAVHSELGQQGCRAGGGRAVVVR